MSAAVTAAAEVREFIERRVNVGNAARQDALSALDVLVQRLAAAEQDNERLREEAEVLRDKLQTWEEAEESGPSWEQVDSANDRFVKAQARVTELERLVVHLFLGAEHDHARHGMWLDLLDFFRLPHQELQAGQWDSLLVRVTDSDYADPDWEASVRAAFARAVLGSVPNG